MMTLAKARKILANAEAAFDALRAARKRGESIDGETFDAALAALHAAQRGACRAPARCAVVHYRKIEKEANAALAEAPVHDDDSDSDDDSDAPDAYDVERVRTDALTALVTGREDIDPDYDSRFDGVLVSD
jgi:hypothetical protein